MFSERGRDFGLILGDPSDRFVSNMAVGTAQAGSGRLPLAGIRKPASSHGSSSELRTVLHAVILYKSKDWCQVSASPRPLARTQAFDSDVIERAAGSAGLRQPLGQVPLATGDPL